MADLLEAALAATESSHWPRRVKICEGMCNACGESGAIVDRLPVLIENREGIDVVALAVSRDAKGQSATKSRGTLFQIIGRWRRPNGVVPGPRDTPVGHRARWVSLRGLIECDARFLVA